MILADPEDKPPTPPAPGPITPPVAPPPPPRPEAVAAQKLMVSNVGIFVALAAGIGGTLLFLRRKR